MACAESDEKKATEPEVTTGTVVLALDHMVDGVPLSMNDTYYTNAAGNPYDVETIYYFISDVVLQAVGGRGTSGPSQFETGLIHLRDAEDATTRLASIADVPTGDYSGVSFVFGLDEEKNVTRGPGGSYPAIYDDLMSWPEIWGGGYHYMRLEGHFEAVDGDTIGYLVHTGRRQFTNDPINGTEAEAHHHHFTVTLDVPLSVGKDETWTVPIYMNLNRWYEGAHQLDLNDYYPMEGGDDHGDGHEGGGHGAFMTNLEVQGMLRDNGAGVFSAGEPAREAGDGGY
jgi:hypothetical protein